MGFLAGPIREIVATIDALLRESASAGAGSGAFGPIEAKPTLDIDDVSGRAVTQIRAHHSALSGSLDLIRSADAELGPVFEQMHENSAAVHTRLRGIRAEVLEAQKQLEPTINTLAGRQQLTVIVATKAAELRAVMGEAQAVSSAAAARIEAIAAKYRQDTHNVPANGPQPPPSPSVDGGVGDRGSPNGWGRMDDMQSGLTEQGIQDDPSGRVGQIRPPLPPELRDPPINPGPAPTYPAG